MQVQDKYKFIVLKLEEGVSRDAIKDELYKRLCKRFPLTDMDVHDCPVKWNTTERQQIEMRTI